jgi:hypothetical protein
LLSNDTTIISTFFFTRLFVMFNVERSRCADAWVVGQ